MLQISGSLHSRGVTIQRLRILIIASPRGGGGGGGRGGGGGKGGGGCGGCSRSRGGNPCRSVSQ